MIREEEDEDEDSVREWCSAFPWPVGGEISMGSGEELRTFSKPLLEPAMLGSLDITCSRNRSGLALRANNSIGV